MSDRTLHARLAAIALLKMAQATSDPKIAAGLIEAAAILKEQAGELAPSLKAPDIQVPDLSLGDQRSDTPFRAA